MPKSQKGAFITSKIKCGGQLTLGKTTTTKFGLREPLGFSGSFSRDSPGLISPRDLRVSCLCLGYERRRGPDIVGSSVLGLVSETENPLGTVRVATLHPLMKARGPLD